MLLKIAKLVYISFLLLTSYLFTVLDINIPNIGTILGVALLLFALLHMIQYRRPLNDFFTSEILVWIVFAIVIFTSSIFVARDVNRAINGVLDFIKNITLMMTMVYFSREDKNQKLLMNTSIVIAILCGITALSIGLYQKERLLLSESANPNHTANQAFTAIVFLSMYIRRKRRERNILISVLIITLSYFIIMTGARQTFVVLVFFLLFWLFLILPEYGVSLSARKKLSMFFAVSIVVVVLVTLSIAFLEDTTVIQRLIFDDDIRSSGRFRMYSNAWAYFCDNPLFGIGFDNYAAYHRAYSHSTYAELLACTGIIGTVTYLSVYFISTRKLLRIIKANEQGSLVRIEAKTMLALLISMVLLGFATIHYYKIVSSVTFGVIFGFIAINSPRKAIT